MTMTESKTYQGWKNYETWCVALWIDNEEPLYKERIGLVKMAWEEAEEGMQSLALTRSARARHGLADDLKAWVDDMAPDLGATLWSDLLTAALSEVDWDEIADNWLSEIEGYEPRKA